MTDKGRTAGWCNLVQLDGLGLGFDSSISSVVLDRANVLALAIQKYLDCCVNNNVKNNQLAAETLKQAKDQECLHKAGII
jgi:hypothetical protein